jgi:hypothetical protein
MKIILDKSFLPAESKDSRRLMKLRDEGGIFIFSDTLCYELCSDDRPEQWPASQKKLFPVLDSVEVWQHVPELLRSEVKDQSPAKLPIHEKKQ